jgi:hypothetical protein
MDIKLSKWIKGVDKELKSDAIPMAKRTLISIREQTIKLVEERGYAYDMMGDKIIRD